MPEAALLALQQALAGLILEPQPEAFTADPAGFAARFGLGAEDQAAFQRGQERLLAYRELARMGLSDPIEEMFPVTQALLEGEGAWAACLDSFMEARCLESPHYRDIAPTFLGWLVATHWGEARWPFLTELAHFELLEVLVSRFPEGAPVLGLAGEPWGRARIILDPATQVVAYRHAVHRATPAEPVPLAEPTCLLAYRDAEAEFHLMELTDAAAALLSRAQDTPLDEVMRGLGLDDLAGLGPLLQDLRERGAILGYQE